MYNTWSHTPLGQVHAIGPAYRRGGWAACGAGPCAGRRGAGRRSLRLHDVLVVVDVKVVINVEPFLRPPTGVREPYYSLHSSPAAMTPHSTCEEVTARDRGGLGRYVVIANTF